MRIIRWTSFSILLAATVLLTGCGTMDMDDVYGRDRGPRDPYYDRAGRDVEGTVQRVNTRDRLIYLDRRDGGRYDLRNDRDDPRDGSPEIAIYYDDRTTVEYQGRTFRPEDLEPGDRIQASIGRTEGGLLAESIQVLYDVSSSGPGGYDDRSDQSDQSDHDRYDRDNRDRYATELRGTVRSVDTRNQTVEIEPSSASRNDSGNPYDRSGVILVQYDSATTVQFEGRRYEPSNLERGDVVEITLRPDRDRGERPMAAQITVVGEGQPVH